MACAQVQVTFDCSDPAALATFWAQVLGYSVPEIEQTDALQVALGRPPGGWYRIEGTTNEGPTINFQLVPEPKTTKNRVHLDVKAPGVEPDHLTAELQRVLSIGARLLQSVTDDVGTYYVLQDPEGNEFCLEG